MDASRMQVGGSHYLGKKVQPWDAMEAWMSPEEFKGFLRGNAIKYLARCWDKNGVEDLRKANHYITKLIEVVDASTSCRSNQAIGGGLELFPGSHSLLCAGEQPGKPT